MKIYETSLKHTLVAEIKGELVSTPEKVCEIMKGYFDENPAQESFWVIMLNRKNKVVYKTLHSIGSRSSSLVCMPTMFKSLVLNPCTAFLTCHNHPSGDPSPSPSDIHVTRKIRDCAKIFDLDFLDHIIYGDPAEDPSGIGRYSFREAGLI